MIFNLRVLPSHRSNKASKPVSKSGLWCWPGSVKERVLTSPRAVLRRFLLLKLATLLLFPSGAGLPQLVICVFSLQALLLLRSPHVSTKPSTVLLGQLALTDTLLFLHWALQLGTRLGLWMEVGLEVKIGSGMVNSLLNKVELGKNVWWLEVVRSLCQCLLDAHHLASLFLLGLLGLEAVLVSHWPLQTRRLRTSHFAQFSCGLVWVLVVVEQLLLLAPQLISDSELHTNHSGLLTSQAHSQGLDVNPLLPIISIYLRKALWVAISWFHYVVFYKKPQKTKSCFH